MNLTGSGRQKKGRVFELDILKDLWAFVGLAWPWSNQRPDDGHSPPAEFQDYHLEMKRQEKLNFWAAIEQAREEAKRTRKAHWAVITRRNRTAPVAIVDYEDWKQLVMAFHDLLRS